MNRIKKKYRKVFKIIILRKKNPIFPYLDDLQKLRLEGLIHPSGMVQWLCLEQFPEDGGCSGKHPMGRAPALPHLLGHLPGHWGTKWNQDTNLSPPYHWGCVLESLTEISSEEIQSCQNAQTETFCLF